MRDLLRWLLVGLVILAAKEAFADRYSDSVPIPVDAAVVAAEPAAAGDSIMIDSGLFENGQPIQLQVVIFKPESAGPFPLLVFNHGSTGKGTDPELFKKVVVDRTFARIFVDKGYLVAFPQRRGRGKSDGLYDEGFYADRTLGYTCEPARALAGADRALVDIEAAVAALRRRQDVKDERVLMAGASRGGALSIAYAGMHPHDVAGVINFVGGWITEDCGLAARQINSTLLARGAAFQRSTLWLYGLHDRFYSLGHSGENFAAFRSVGGKGVFLPFDMGGNGHAVINDSAQWRPDVDRYLDEIDRSGGK